MCTWHVCRFMGVRGPIYHDVSMFVLFPHYFTRPRLRVSVHMSFRLFHEALEGVWHGDGFCRISPVSSPRSAESFLRLQGGEKLRTTEIPDALIPEKYPWFRLPGKFPPLAPCRKIIERRIEGRKIIFLCVFICAESAESLLSP